MYHHLIKKIGSERYINHNFGVLFNPKKSEIIDLFPCCPEFKIFVLGDPKIQVQSLNLLSKQLKYNSYVGVSVKILVNIPETNLATFLGVILFTMENCEYRMSVWWKNNFI